MKRNKLLCIVAAFFWLASGYTQTIDLIVETIFKNNPELKAMDMEYQAAVEKSNQVKRIPDTELSAGVFALPVETRVGSQFLRLSGMQAFPQTKVINQKESLARSKSEVIRQKIAVKKQELNYLARKAILDWYLSDQSQLIIQQNIKILKSLEQIALAKTEIGKASAADVLQIQIKIKAFEQEMAILENQKDFPKIEIQRMLQIENDLSLKILDDIQFATLPYDIDSLEQMLFNQHPQIQLFNLQQEVSRQSMMLNQLDQKPVFGAGIDYIMVNKTDLAIENNGQDIVQLKAVARIPIYKKHFDAKDREEQLMIKALDFRKEELLNRYTATVRNAYVRHETNRLKKELYEDQIKLTQSAINILQSNYSAKGERFDELINLINDLTSYDLKLLKVIVESQYSKLEIEQLLFAEF